MQKNKAVIKKKRSPNSAEIYIDIKKKIQKRILNVLSVHKFSPKSDFEIFFL